MIFTISNLVYVRESMMGFNHSLVDVFLVAALLVMTLLHLKNKKWRLCGNCSSDDRSRFPFKNRGNFYKIRRIFTKRELERKYLDTLKDLQDLKLALDESSIVQIVDKSGNILYANEKFCSLSEYSLDEIKGKNMRVFNSNYHSREYFEELWTTVSQGRVWSGEIRNKSKSGNYYWVYTTIVPFLDKNKKPFRYIVIRNDITKSKENEKKLEYLSNVDGLTSLFNRRYFDKTLDGYWESFTKVQNPLSVILFDVDDFKGYNDHYGHILGDKCLLDISNHVKELLDPYEAVCARFGGEEFAVILPKMDLQEACKMAEKIRVEIEQLHIPHDRSKLHKWVTVSLGVASVVPNPTMNPKELVELADQALYQAKNSGRNRVGGA